MKKTIKTSSPNGYPNTQFDPIAHMTFEECVIIEGQPQSIITL